MACNVVVVVPQMALLLMVAILCGTLGQVSTRNHGATDDKFLMILFDGLRWDYLNFEGLENFKRFQKNGLRAEYMQVDYPSLSFPGYYTILTGLHPENHGFVGNNMYDPVKKMFFDTHLGHDSNESFWWEQAEPLWTAATRGGKNTHVYLWPGCHVPIHNIRPQSCEPYEFSNDTRRMEKDLDDIIAKFSTGVADAGFVYVEYTDAIGHMFGPNSPEIKVALENVDRVIGSLLDNLEKKSLTEKVNIVLVSDHGMTTVDFKSWTVIRIADVINPDDVEMMIGGGSSMGIIPLPEKLDKVYESLKKIPCFYVWRKEEIPEELHFKHNNRVPPITITTKKNCYIAAIQESTKQYPYRTKGDQAGRSSMGDHGYLPEENKDMRAIFLASGPAFIKNRRVAPIYAVDVYQLAVHLMGIRGQPNNGTWSHVSDMLKSSTSPSSISQLSMVVSVSAFGVLMHFVFMKI